MFENLVLLGLAVFMLAVGLFSTWDIPTTSWFYRDGVNSNFSRVVGTLMIIGSAVLALGVVIFAVSDL